MNNETHDHHHPRHYGSRELGHALWIFWAARDGTPMVDARFLLDAATTTAEASCKGPYPSLGPGSPNEYAVRLPRQAIEAFVADWITAHGIPRQLMEGQA